MCAPTGATCMCLGSTENWTTTFYSGTKIWCASAGAICTCPSSIEAPPAHAQVVLKFCVPLQGPPALSQMVLSFVCHCRRQLLHARMCPQVCSSGIADTVRNGIGSIGGLDGLGWAGTSVRLSGPSSSYI
eukprot:1142216-Pelagomonas_calceolata.AAC.3